MNRFLNIYIPSYNRPDKCLFMVTKLLKQVKNFNNLKITILDNCSEINYEEYFLNDVYIPQYIDKGILKVIRNNVNIGMSANIMKCFEYSSIDTGWLWIISDDDLIRDNAIENVFNSIYETSNDVGFIKFSSKNLLHKKTYIIDSAKKLIKYISVNPRVRFNSYIFLTNIIYRIETFKESIACAYDYNLTHCPQFILLTLSISTKSFIKHDQNQLVDYKRAKIGYSYGLFAGIQIGSIKPLLINDTTIRDFHYIFQVHNDMKVAIDLFYELFSKGSTKKLPALLFVYWFNLLFAKCYLRSIFFIPIIPLVIIPPLRGILLKLLIKSKYSSEIIEIKKRYKII